jgi:type II secretory pathway pseudopilin PulG
MNYQLNNKLKNKQQGATLITSLIMLLIMTIVGVAATKSSSMSILIAGNDQQKILLAQTLDSELSKFASIETLEKSFTKNGFTPSAGQTNKYIFAQDDVDDLKVNKEITNLNFNYACKRNGKASDLGADAPSCDLYDFYIDLKRSASSARDTRHQGSGKMVPSKQHSADATKGNYHFVD